MAKAKPQLKLERFRISDLTLDPENALEHPSRNIEAIRNSLREFGQRKPIVVGRDMIVQAGNGTVEAAKAEGWSEIDGVWSDLEGAKAAAYAIADNRSGEFAEWSVDQLSETWGKLDEELQHAAGWSQAEIDKLMGKARGEVEVLLDQAIQLKPQAEYCVIMAQPGEEWERLKLLLGLKPVRRGGYKHGSPFDAVQTQRVLHLSDLERAIGRPEGDAE